MRRKCTAEIHFYCRSRVCGNRHSAMQDFSRKCTCTIYARLNDLNKEKTRKEEEREREREKGKEREN